MRHLLFYFVAISTIFADEIVIHLNSEGSKPNNLYLATLRPLNSSYEQNVYEILRKDLLLSEKLSILDLDENMQFLAHHTNPNVAFQTDSWKKQNVKYVVVPKIEKQNLVISLFDVNTANLKTLTPISLTLNLTKDAPSIHKAADLITKLTTNLEGIASKKILYSCQMPSSGKEENWKSEIWEMDYDGSNPRQVTYEDSYSITPAFIPNPKKSDPYKFVYVTYRQGPPRIYISSKHKTKGAPLIPLRGNQLLPQVSPKLDKIAFISDASGRADLFIQPFSMEKGAFGKPIQLFSSRGSVQASPSFDPEGKKIAFVSDKSGNPKIYIIDAEITDEARKTPNLKLLSKLTHDSTSPSWSPDGKKIAFSSKTNGVRQIWIYDIEKDVEKQLTTGAGDKENPSWASDSIHLVYNSTTPTHDIFMVNTLSPIPKRLTDGPGIKHYPVFEP